MISIDGNYLEGGGQILRTALALSAITQKPFEISDIRKGRCESGLKHQHMYCVRALSELCDAKADGDDVGSETLKFFPGKIKPKTIDIDIETAGSITLLLQSLLLPCLFAGGRTRLRITGGTDVRWSMPVDYFRNVLLPQLHKYAEIDFSLAKRGYYPKGSGRVEINIKPKFNFDDRMQADDIVLLEQGDIMQIKGISHASSDLQKAEVAERQAMSAQSMLKQTGCPVDIITEYHNTASTGSGIALWAIFSKSKEGVDFVNPIRIGADALGERGKKAEEVGKEAAERLIGEIRSKAPVDEYLADNLIPFMALFGQDGMFKAARISNHTLTNIYVVEKFLDVKFVIDKENNVISVKK
ncbi:RNA 3'-phosphate cyclase [Candidatus Woesearchaeota archaeon CG10_big_fil_rev_8_21_14_0_10_44_13]|nr:MAG: RNA 3'-phosphate cyclase [Candidatus Woesearchaeota archaeon CG10_big_fil_rev_8_21_14_0_10_44_13]